VQRGDLVRLKRLEAYDDDRYGIGMVINLGSTKDMNGIWRPLAWVRWYHPAVEWNMAHGYRALEMLDETR
jgi:hypothetical protein